MAIWTCVICGQPSLLDLTCPRCDVQFDELETADMKARATSEVNRMAAADRAARHAAKVAERDRHRAERTRIKTVRVARSDRLRSMRMTSGMNWLAIHVFWLLDRYG